jgi:hypothetical protein
MQLARLLKLRVLALLRPAPPGPPSGADGEGGGASARFDARAARLLGLGATHVLRDEGAIQVGARGWQGRGDEGGFGRRLATGRASTLPRTPTGAARAAQVLRPPRARTRRGRRRVGGTHGGRARGREAAPRRGRAGGGRFPQLANPRRRGAPPDALRPCPQLRPTIPALPHARAARSLCTAASAADPRRWTGSTLCSAASRCAASTRARGRRHTPPRCVRGRAGRAAG